MKPAALAQLAKNLKIAIRYSETHSVRPILPAPYYARTISLPRISVARRSLSLESRRGVTHLGFSLLFISANIQKNLHKAKKRPPNYYSLGET
jgi:hypothetical protein